MAKSALKPRRMVRDLHVRIDDDTKALLDKLRRKEPDMPSGSEMMRRLIHRAKP